MIWGFLVHYWVIWGFLGDCWVIWGFFGDYILGYFGDLLGIAGARWVFLGDPLELFGNLLGITGLFGYYTSLLVESKTTGSP